MNRGAVGGITTGVILFLALLFGVMCTEKIPAGYVGIQYNMNGGIEEDTLGQGWHLISPTKKVTEYSVSIEQS